MEKLNVILLLFIVLSSVAIVLLRIYRAGIIGYIGEKKVAFVLSLLNRKYRVFNDVLIATANGTTQIDHIVVSPFGVFVVETKNYKGWITGSEHSYKWTKNVYGKKYDFPNPITQNKGHVAALKKVLHGYDSDVFVSVIVFAMRCKLKTKIRKECNVVRLWRLLSRIGSYKNRVLSHADVERICSMIEQKNIRDKKIRKGHVRYVKQQEKRAKKLLRDGCCPVCGAPLVLRNGKYGSFYGCSNYPYCSYIAK